MTVRRWRRRFAEEGLAGLADHDRLGRPVAQLLLTGQERDQLTRWARRAKTSQALETWKTSKDPRYAAKKARIEHLYAIANRVSAEPGTRGG